MILAPLIGSISSLIVLIILLFVLTDLPLVTSSPNGLNREIYL